MHILCRELKAYAVNQYWQQLVLHVECQHLYSSGYTKHRFSLFDIKSLIAVQDRASISSQKHELQACGRLVEFTLLILLLKLYSTDVLMWSDSRFQATFALQLNNKLQCSRYITANGTTCKMSVKPKSHLHLLAARKENNKKKTTQAPV